MNPKMLAATLFAVVLISPAPMAEEAPAPGGEGLRLVDHMPRDPLMVMDSGIGDLNEILDGMVDLMVQFQTEITREKFDESFAALDEKLGLSLREDLLAQIAGEFAVAVDLPPVDEIAGSFADPVAAINMMFGRVGVLARVRDGDRLDRALRALFALADGKASEQDGLVRIDFDVPAGVNEAGEPAPLEIHLFYGIREGVFSLGMSADRVRAYLSARPEGDRLTDGADFRTVFEHLDDSPESLSYFNLPEIRKRIESSQFLAMMQNADEQVGLMMRLLLSDAMTSSGFGTTSVARGGGVRKSSFGPDAWSGGTMTTGIIAAIAIPNLLNAIDRGKQKRTMADLRSAGTAIESFAIDNNRYPGPTEGWVEIGAVAADLEPVYIHTLPRLDGWGNTLMLWSDGASYVIVSPAKDGEMDRDWTGPFEGVGATGEFRADIVFANGQFVQWPEGTQN